MPRFAANLSMLFTEVPLPQRFARAAAAGFRFVECQFPYDFPADALRAEMDAAGLQMVLHNLPAGDWAAGDRGIACDPTRVAEFRAGVPRALAYAKALDVPQLNLLAGLTPPGVPAAQVRATFLDNLRFAADALTEHGRTLLIEPLNTFDLPGFWLHSSHDAQALIEEAARPNVKIQFDLYHLQRMQGELAGTLQRQLPHIGHVQFADNPGRHEPGTGELNFGFLFDHLDRIGYTGFVGAEYLPLAGTEAGLGWLARFQA
ncbi:hydroxypyruvate isomerase [Ideonella azotifigens]|uniref:Hydroxypyruvate isomerase n=1 Tax=Ideonella azotifigens TaxID=513160 RepID=A0ABN1KHR0_9BURK|nr:hydroxypyruvate isomerase [Ideonella azotifigens]MCD2344933.1 hydroxypyruvate isomerase [Ideonella azotifigens]